MKRTVNGLKEATVADNRAAVTLCEEPLQVSHLDASLSPFLTQLMAGLGEQIKAMASEAAASVVAREKDRILKEFRAHLQDEAAKTLEQVMAASKEEFASRALKELTETHEAAAQVTYDRWLKKMEQDLEKVTTSIQESMDSSRRETAERFRSQAAPVLSETKAALQKLVAFQDQIKVNMVTMCKQFEDFLQHGAEESGARMHEKIMELEKQFEKDVNARLAAAHAALTEDSAQTLLKISQDFQQTAREQLDLLAASAAERATNALKENSAQIGRQSLSELQSHTRSHLEFLSQSIADIAKKQITDANNS
jgi:hypothetical protein